MYGGFGRCLTEEKLWKKRFGREYRADFFLPDQDPPIVIEYDGLVGVNSAAGRKKGWGNAGHASVSAIMRDQWKANLTQLMGYMYFRFNAATIGNGDAYWILDQVLKKVP